MSTITTDEAEIFPTCPTYGFQTEPRILVKITKREGGYEKRNRIWDRSLRTYTGVPIGDRIEDDVLDILDFWEAMGAMAMAFRFSDPLDYKSCRRSITPTRTDQPLLSTGVMGHYQLIKEYPTKSGRVVQVRDITRPVGSTISIANETGTLQTDWTLDESTGILVKGGSFSGVPTSWGGEFDVWVRFDAQFAPSISNKQILSADVQLQELRPDN